MEELDRSRREELWKQARLEALSLQQALEQNSVAFNKGEADFSNEASPSLPILLHSLKTAHHYMTHDVALRDIDALYAQTGNTNILSSLMVVLRSSDGDLSDLIAIRLATMVSDVQFDDVTHYILDETRTVASRIYFIASLKKMSKSTTMPLLLNLLEHADESIAVNAAEILASRKATRAAPRLQALSASSDPSVRNQAKRALKKMLPENPTRGLLREGLPEFVSTKAETSTNLDFDQFRPLLKRLSALVSGIGPSDMKELINRVELAEDNDDLVFEVQVTFRNIKQDLWLVVEKEQAEALCVAFYGTVELIKQVSEVLSTERPSYSSN